MPITKENLVDEGIPVISYGQIHAKSNSGVHINDDLVRYVTPDYLKTHSDSLVKLGDIIFADTSEDHDGVGNCIFIDRNDNIFAGYHTIIARSNDKCNYFAYQFQTDGWRSQLRSIVSGIKVFSITQRNLKETRVIVPPAHTQQRIAAYLDTQCARIDATIANIRSLIAKLKEYKQSVITEAVTKGLDPDVPMKDSGVPWIGKVPEGWQVCPLKWRVHFVKTGGTPAGAQDIFYADDGFPWFTPSDFGDSLRISESAKKLSDLGIKEVKIFPKNCVLMIGIGATMGKVALSSCDCSANQQINSIVCDDKLFPLFLTFFLKTITDYLFKCGKFTTLPILNQEETKSIIVPVPSFAEQQRIADYLDTQCAKIDTALARQEELLTKLEAYKKSLIYECVTGKREVPASA